MTDIFLSYSRDDQATAHRFAEGFERAGFSVWWDVTLRSGQTYDQVTEQALRDAKAVVVLWSKKSVKSDWVRSEATIALRNGTLVPAMIELCERPVMFELKQTADLSNWKGASSDKTWLALLNDVQHMVGGGAATVAAPTPRIIARKSWVLPAAAAAILAIAAAGGFWAFHNGNTTAASTQASAAVPAIPTTAVSTTEKPIAVLPFTNLSDDANQEYFADGLTEELINKLSQVQGLQVTGRNSSFYFKGKNDALRDIGQQLGVKHLLQGSVRKAGDQLRISAQLLDVETNANLWSKNFDRKLTDIFTVQDEIAEAVTTALSVALRAGKFSDPAMTGNVAAYDAFLQGNKLAADVVNGKASALDAIAQFEKAVSLDQNFGMGWIRLADLYSTSITLTPRERDDFAAKAKHAREQANALVPNHPLVKLFQAGDEVGKRDYAAVERTIKPLLENSGSAESVVAVTYARFLWTLGRPQESLKYATRARRLDPLDWTGPWSEANAWQNMNQPDEAEAVITKALATGTATQFFSGLRFISALVRKDKAAAVAVVRQYPNFNKTMYSLTDKWEKEGSTAALAELHRIVAAGNLPPVAYPLYRQWAAALGEPAFVLELMNQQAGATGDVWLPLYKDTRKLPGFKDWLRERGLVDYWRATGNWGDYCKPLPNTESDFECN